MRNQRSEQLGLPLLARRGLIGPGGACLLCPGNSDLDLFRYGKGIINLDLCMPEQELHRSQITGYAGRSGSPFPFSHG